MACTCIETMDAALVDHNGRISATMCFPRVSETRLGEPYETVTISVDKIASRGKRPPMAAPTFCPFCGTRYVPLSAEPLTTGSER